mmetsp:Transcript_23424/g.68426  ORF Transcript_23424/g.68426 Transcript_23424/m.68426 type:complete len:243 (-) Transcript_23424:1071-1799(-)
MHGPTHQQGVLCPPTPRGRRCVAVASVFPRCMVSSCSSSSCVGGFTAESGSSSSRIRSPVGVVAKPPRPVHRSSRGICLPTLSIARITSSSGTTAVKSDNAMLAQERALLAASTFLPRHGASTRLPMGSQVMPKAFCSARDAAARACSFDPPARLTMAAAAMLEPAPHSAMHPPTSAAKVASRWMNTPISPATKNASQTWRSVDPRESATAKTAPGQAPQDPAVGAATIKPIEDLTSMMEVT